MTMSDVVERTLAALPGLFGGGIVGTGDAGFSSGSRGFMSFVKNLKDCSTKFEEEQVLKREVKLLRQKLSQPDTSQAQIKEYVTELILCDMLGCDVSFGYINAIKLAQQGSLLERRIGYLATCLLLHENHELSVLLVNSLQKDLRSSNILEVCCALTVLCHLANVDIIPMMLPLVEEKLSHPRELVRKKAVMCLHRFFTRAPNLVQHVHQLFKKALCDKDPGVMTVALHIYMELIKDNPEKYRDIVPSLINILRQVIERKLPKTFEFHHVPAPWVQINILKMLALLGKNDQRSSNAIYPVLTEVLQRSEINQNITFGVVQECILTGAALCPHPKLLEDLAKCIGKFLRAKSNNLRYLGLKSLAAIVEVDPAHAVNHQMTMIDCLEDKDVTIRRKTLELLCKMTNKSNVAVICSKMLEHFRRDTDQYLRSDLITKILMLSEKFCTTIEWYLEMVNSIVLTAPECITDDVTHSVIRTIKDGTESIAPNETCQKFAAETYLGLLEEHGLSTPRVLVQISAWVLGHYWTTLEGQPTDVAAKLIYLLVPFVNSDVIDNETKHWILNALSKLVVGCQNNDILSAAMIPGSLLCVEPHLKHRISEVVSISWANDQMKTSMDFNGDLSKEFDFTLSFLDDFVSDALEAGASPYMPASLQQKQIQETEAMTSLFASLKHTEPMLPSVVDSQHSQSSVSQASGSSGNTDQVNKETALNLKGVRRVWGPASVTPSKGQHGEEIAAIETNSPTNTLPQPSVKEISDEERRKKELASALFSGIS